MYHTVMFPEKKLLGNIGYDGAVYLRFVKVRFVCQLNVSSLFQYNIIFLVSLSIVSLAVLAPINSAGKVHFCFSF